MYRCTLLGVCESWGMPSSHTQVIAYALGTCLLLALSRGKDPLPKMIAAAEISALASLTIAVAFARVYLGYHTALQVCIGGLLGLLFGMIWMAVVVMPLKRSGKRMIERLPLLKTLGFTNESYNRRHTEKSRAQ